MSYRIDVLRACCSMFINDFKNLNAVMFPWWLKDSKDSLIDYKTTNVMPFSSGLELLSMSRFPSTEAVLLSQPAFNFPNWLFHKCLIKTRKIIIYPLKSVRWKVQDEDYNIRDASQSKTCKFHHNILYF